MDLWGFSYWIWTRAGIDEYGIKTTGAEDFIIVSLGKKEIRENGTDDPRRAGLFRESPLHRPDISQEEKRREEDPPMLAPARPAARTLTQAGPS
jgi:hypothetical protein